MRTNELKTRERRITKKALFQNVFVKLNLPKEIRRSFEKGVRSRRKH